MYNTCVEEGGFWHCPNGHRRGYGEGTLQARLRRETKKKEWAEQQAKHAKEHAKHAEERANRAKRKAAAAKGQVTRLKNRACAGVCPCCNRSFQNLYRHMQNKHPDYKDQE